MTKPILVLDFDGVIHSYSSGWQGADVIPDPPVAGAMQFIWDATDYFRVAIFSSRSNQAGGLQAMQVWLKDRFTVYWRRYATLDEINTKFVLVEWPLEKPSAFVTLDDRAITFEGVWPSFDSLKRFTPWNKRK